MFKIVGTIQTDRVSAQAGRVVLCFYHHALAEKLLDFRIEITGTADAQCFRLYRRIGAVPQSAAEPLTFQDKPLHLNQFSIEFIDAAEDLTHR